MLRKARAQPFNCRFVGLLYIHNYLMFLRDKSCGIIKDMSQLSLLDIRGTSAAEHHDQHRVFKSTWFDLELFMKKHKEFEADPTRYDSREWVLTMTKQHISTKYLFIIGFHDDFDNDTFRDFIKFLMDLPTGKPFQLFLYKYNQEILQIEFPYLYLEGDKKKALSLYPNILLKCVDLGLSDQKQKFQICMGDNFKIQLD